MNEAIIILIKPTIRMLYPTCVCVRACAFECVRVRTCACVCVRVFVYMLVCTRADACIHASWRVLVHFTSITDY